MKSFAWTLLLLTLASFHGAVQADDVEVNDEEDDSTTAADEEDTYEDDYDVHEVTTSYHIPEYPDGRLPVGKAFTILVDFSNRGQDVFNVTKVAAFLHSPYDLNYYIQNFTAKAVSGMAGPSSQVSFEYKVTPDAKLEPLEFWLSGFVEYTMEGSDEPYQQMFVNTTVELFDGRGSFEFSSVFTVVLVLGALGVAGRSGALNAAEKVTGKKRKKLTGAAKGPADYMPSEEWDVAAYKPSDKSRTRARGGKKASKNAGK